MRESIFFASIRIFFLTLFSIIGITLGFLIIIAVAGAMSDSLDGQPEITYTYTPEILANADGVRKELSKDAPVILQLNIKGVIGVDGLTQASINQQLIESQERSLEGRVKAIFLYIDSPGGTVTDAEGIYLALKKYKEKHKVPIYAYADGLCASGGMYIACAADKIFASQSSLIGSVGVIISSIFNYSQLMEKVGLQAVTLYEGKGKDDLNPTRPWRKGEEDNIKDAIAYYYDVFTTVVSTNRPLLTKEKLINDDGADVYPAATAKEKGYIDVANVDSAEALKELAKKIDIEDDYYQVITLENKNWVTQLLKGQFELLSGKVTHRLELSNELHPDLAQKYLYLYRH